MRGIKNLVFVIPLLVMAMSIVAIPTVFAGTTTVSISPEASLDYGVGEEFSVDVYISDVKFLGGWEIQLAYDTSLLTATTVTVLTDWFGPEVVVWKNLIDDEAHV